MKRALLVCRITLTPYKGGFLTELWSHEQIQRAHFLQRNRIIAGLAQATIVVESKSKGGALTTAAYALGYERDVFAVPGRPNDTVAQGCLELIKTQKATCITSGEDGHMKQILCLFLWLGHRILFGHVKKILILELWLGHRIY